MKQKENKLLLFIIILTLIGISYFTRDLQKDLIETCNEYTILKGTVEQGSICEKYQTILNP